MKFVQRTIWIVTTMVTLVVEMIFRILVCFPLGLILTILASFFGFKHWSTNNWFLDYCCPWKLDVKYFPTASAVSRWFNPDII